MYHAYFTTQILVTLFQTGYPDNWQKFSSFNYSSLGFQTPCKVFGPNKPIAPEDIWKTRD